VIRERNGAEEKPSPLPASREEILRDFAELIREGKLSGAAHDPSILDGSEFDTKVIQKKGKGTRYLRRPPPSPARMLRIWMGLFGNAVSPRQLLDRLAERFPGFEHREDLLLFGKGWMMYDAEIFENGDKVGELTLSFESMRDPAARGLASFTGARLKVVRIEHIHLAAHTSGYASTLFRHYERLFRDLGFNQFRLSASLSVGKYYWAKEGFDFSDGSELGKRKGRLLAFVVERGLPVTEAEIEALSHASGFAGFRKDLKVAAYRDAEGYYSFERNDRFREEVSLPLGKAFLLCSAPWEGYKNIPPETQEPFPEKRGGP
jgi:hypothetical protein